MRTKHLILAFAAAILLPVCAFARGFDLTIDASSLEQLGELTTGFTDVVPPRGLRQFARSCEADGGLRVELTGTELSAWRLAPLPAESRYLLRWHFDYVGRLERGEGRVGFAFGRGDGADLLSVEMTRHGSLRLVRWGMQFDDPHGRIAWAKQLGASRDVHIEADYDIKAQTLVCRVNGGSPIEIDLARYMPSAPITIRGAGYFTAVPEAPRLSRMYPSSSEYDIELSTRDTVALHKSLAISAE